MNRIKEELLVQKIVPRGEIGVGIIANLGTVVFTANHKPIEWCFPSGVQIPLHSDSLERRVNELLDQNGYVEPDAEVEEFNAKEQGA